MEGHEQSLWAVRCEKPFSRKSKETGKEPDLQTNLCSNGLNETGRSLEGCEAWRVAASSKLGWKQAPGLIEVSSLEPGVVVHAFTPRT